MLKAIRVSAMSLALAGSVYGGEILTPPAPEQPKPSAMQEPSATDEETAVMTDTMTQIVLAVLLDLLP